MNVAKGADGQRQAPGGGPRGGREAAGGVEGVVGGAPPRFRTPRGRRGVLWREREIAGAAKWRDALSSAPSPPYSHLRAENPIMISVRFTQGLWTTLGSIELNERNASSFADLPDVDTTCNYDSALLN